MTVVPVLTDPIAGLEGLLILVLAVVVQTEEPAIPLLHLIIDLRLSAIPEENCVRL